MRSSPRRIGMSGCEGCSTNRSSVDPNHEPEVLSMRVLLRVLVSTVVIGGLAACDPLYGVGARQYLTPVPLRTDSTSAARKDASTPPAPDIPRTADCLEAALRATPAVSDVQRWKEP